MMFQAGVPEKIVQERTGHRSLEALRVCMSAVQLRSTWRCRSTQKYQKDEAKSTCNSSLPAKQSDTAGGVCFSIFGTTTNCVINVNLAGQPPKLDN